MIKRTAKRTVKATEYELDDVRIVEKLGYDLYIIELKNGLFAIATIDFYYETFSSYEECSRFYDRKMYGDI